jgi:TetR/AcrR family acrAB operon transcriptional repressor
VRERHLRVRSEWVERFRQALSRGAAVRGIRLSVSPPAAAQGLQALVDGLIQNWLLDPDDFDLESAGTKAVDCLRARLEAGLTGSHLVAIPLKNKRMRLRFAW